MAASILLRRRTVRRSLIEWARYKGYEPAPHHQLIIGEIERFLEGSEEVLLIFAPPGSGKSIYVSILLASWYLARYPHNSILAATHSVEFAQRWGRRVRNDIILDAPTLGISVSNDNAAADRWALNQGGEYYGVGAGTGISGFRADLGLGDDFFGSREDAFSETTRQKRWDWYIDDFSARLKPGAKRILMNTRWHEDDVAGRVLSQIERKQVTGRVISLPAKAEDNDALGRKPGEYLWDEPTYNYGAFLRARERETSPLMWAALYQQRPSPETGDYIQEGWIKPYEKAPARDTLTVYGGSDYAVTADGGDYTVHVVIGVDPEDRLYLLDLWRAQAASDQWVESFCDLVVSWKPMGWAEELGQIKSGVGPFLTKRQNERKAYVAREAFPTKGDKAVRAQSIRGRMALNGLYVPVRAPWYSEFRRELLSFPSGKHDDQVDALGLVGQLLDKMTAGRKPKSEERKQRDAYAERNERNDEVSVLTL